MAKIYAMIADGSEEVECLAVVDVLKRAKQEVVLTSAEAERTVTGSHGIKIVCDTILQEADLKDADVIFLPGGMPGTNRLAACRPLGEALLSQNAAGKRIAAICAAPSILGGLGLLKGKRATCYPGFEEKLEGAVYCHEGVVTDGNISTARGLGYALDLGLELCRLLEGSEAAASLKQAIQYDQF